MVLLRYKLVPPDTYIRVKKVLQGAVWCHNIHHFMNQCVIRLKSYIFEWSVAAYYYKNGTLVVEGDDKNSFFRSIVHQVNKLVSRKDYLSH
ncbi:MAG: hypothetical protein ACREAR_00465 [Nitrosotalea sp.]